MSGLFVLARRSCFAVRSCAWKASIVVSARQTPRADQKYVKIYKYKCPWGRVGQIFRTKPVEGKGCFNNS